MSFESKEGTALSLAVRLGVRRFCLNTALHLSSRLYISYRLSIYLKE